MLRFGRFELQPVHRRLLRDGVPLLVGSRAYDVLLALAERSDRIVGKAELLDLVWADTVVEENNLQVQISGLRKLLGPHAIVTIPGRGYRLAIAPFDFTAHAAAGEAVSLGRDRYGADIPHDGLPALYGRRRDAAELRVLLVQHRLMTLVGAGGVGKTRLAQDVAVSLRDDFANGIAFVDCALLQSFAELPPLIAESLGMTLPAGADPAGALGHALHACKLLMVLDNCEHVIAATAALLTFLLSHTAHVSFLVTSQEPLHIAQEQLFRVPPLAVPVQFSAPETQTPVEVHDTDEAGAVTLFMARAREADLRFQLSRANVRSVIAICQRLDGNPLAIELAAARVPLLGVDGVLARLDDRFKMLIVGTRGVPLRQQTLHAALDWSHALLNADEQQVFWRLGVLVGSFTLQQAQKVATDERMDAWAVLGHLAALVDKSLVVAEGADEPRYRLPETNRVYAKEKLLLAGQTEHALRRLAELPELTTLSSPMTS